MFYIIPNEKEKFELGELIIALWAVRNNRPYSQENEHKRHCYNFRQQIQDWYTREGKRKQDCEQTILNFNKQANYNTEYIQRR